MVAKMDANAVWGFIARIGKQIQNSVQKSCQAISNIDTWAQNKIKTRITVHRNKGLVSLVRLRDTSQCGTEVLIYCVELIVLNWRGIESPDTAVSTVRARKKKSAPSLLLYIIVCVFLMITVDAVVLGSTKQSTLRHLLTAYNLRSMVKLVM